MKISLLRVVLALALGGVVAACDQIGGSGGLIPAGSIVGGGSKQIAGVQPVGGFLPNPGLLAPGHAGQPELTYLNLNANLAQYHKVILDPVTVWASPQSALAAASPAQQEALANTFYADLYAALSQSCQMVNTASPGTVHLRFALVDANPTNAAVTTVATYAPYVSTAYSAASIAFNHGVGYFAGTATVEGFARDATTGTVLWQGVDRRGGTNAVVKNTLNDWLDVDNAFKGWSTQLATRVQQLGMCQ